jgi:SAM-dependent methyltransferase
VAEDRRIRGQRRDWEEIASFNPEWGVLTLDEFKHDAWDMEPFLESGSAQVAEALAAGAELGLPRSHRAALDFGCGVGRLAPALASEFESYIGIDISEGMLERARSLHAGLDNASFVLNEAGDLEGFESGSFDGIFSFLVLQHMTSREMIRGYLAEMARVLAPGGLLAIQLITHIPLVFRLRVRRRLYRVARKLGVGVDRAHRWGLQSMVLTATPVGDVVDTFAAQGVEVRRHDTVRAAQGVRSTTYYATKEAPDSSM